MTENERLMQGDIDAFGMETGDKFALALMGLVLLSILFYGGIITGVIYLIWKTL